MGHVIALAGKGGTGKTTIAALITRFLKEKSEGHVLAIDADPNSNLADSLGLKPQETIGSILDNISSHPESVPSGMSKDRFIEYEIQTAVQEGKGFDVLTMGRPEGPGCYCYVNNVLRNIMDKLIRNYDFIVIDNEAGLEHLSRRTTRQADTLIIVSDPTKVGLIAAQRINALSKDLKLKIGGRYLLVNKCPGNGSTEYKTGGLDTLGCIPSDPGIEEISLKGCSLLGLKNSSPALKQLFELGEKVWLKN